MISGKRRAVFPVLAVIAVMCAGCGTEYDWVPAGAEKVPDQTIRGFTAAESKGGVKKWELAAERADIYQKKNETFLIKPFIKYFDENEEVVYTITSSEGLMNTKTNDGSVKGNVVVVSKKDGSVLTTESLKWDSKIGKITSEDFVRQENDDVIITGCGLEICPDTEKAQIKENVKVVKKRKGAAKK